MTAARVTWIGGRLFLSLLVLAVAAFLVYALGSFTPLPVQSLDSIA
jgi:hypothetical protein